VREQFVLPTGTVTLLLADIEGSVRLWEADAESMPAAMARHDELLAEIVRAHEGVLPRDQGEGDSFVAAFSRPSDALACALALQLTYADEDWANTPIKLRLALHTGEVQLRDEGNYIGHAVNRCARIRDIAHGGQTLLSRSTFDLVVDRPPNDATFKDLGTHRLRDLARPEHVHQLDHPHLPDDFPALRSLDALPNNLPVQLTSFVGREAEMTEVRALLGDTRMLTLTGSGGCGKTRLALQVVADLLEDYTDGVWVVDLSAITDPAMVPKAVASVLRLREQPGRSLVEAITAHLASSQCLLVLDNCEHLVTACAELAETLLKSCLSVTLLVTSREQLGVPAETPWRVPSLSLPDENEPPRIEALTTYDAVALFIERAKKTRPNFRVTNDNAPAVAEVCHRLDGIPLAIELAAARVRVLTPKQIVDGLHDRFHLLTGVSRVGVPRQQTLQASVDWSYDLLGEEEKTVFRRLSVFAGGCTLDAAEVVCSGDGIEPTAVLEILSHLVDRSLVVMEEEGDEGRYRLLQTIREYARDRLAESGEESSVRARHRDAFLDIATSGARAAYGPMDESFARFETEHDNLRAALEWSRQRDDDDALVRMTGALVLFWMLRWHSDEGRRWTNEALSRTAGQRTGARARILNGLGYLELGTWNVMPVPALANEALAIYRELGDRLGEATSLQLLGTMAAYIGQHEMARPQLREAESIAREVLNEEAADDGPAATRRALGILAASLESLGYSYVYSPAPDPAAAADALDEALSVARSAGAEDLARRALLWRGGAEQMRGEYRRAQTWFEAALESARQGRSTVMQGWALNDLGWTLVWQGEHERARSCLEESIALTSGTGLAPQNMWTRLGLAVIKLREGDVEDALPLFRSETATAPEGPLTHVWTFGWLAWAELEAGELDAAGEHLLQANNLMTEVMDPTVSWLRGIEASLAFMQRDFDRAEELAHIALATAARFGLTSGMAQSVELLGVVAASLESVEEAIRLIAAASAAFGRTGYVPGKLDGERTEAAVARLREALGPQAFEAAWVEGERMSLDEAVAYAQRGRGERKRPSSGWKSLTPTELEVTKLVAEGLKNAEIAERMFISKHTAESHLKHIYAKLGISSRTELALEATRRGVANEEQTT
jgi:predicted ATPase/class 3 adenylate cyclase/DNA-binding CsgD family transcriptional regulator/Tfp pilus assembly protein PilF